MLVSKEILLDELLDRYEALCEDGCAPRLADICAECPELISDLRARIDALARVDVVLGDGEDTRKARETAEAPEKASNGRDAYARRQNVATRQPALPRELRAIAVYAPDRTHAVGGLGEVLTARQVELNRVVALKRIRPEKLRESIRLRFLREAAVTARLQHPGIVPIYTLGNDEIGPFYTMPLIEGRTLQQAIDEFHADRANEPAQFSRTSRFRGLIQDFISVCNTIDYAHDQGIVHRDLKPPNIMLGLYGETLVMDWGLAKPFHQNDSVVELLGDLSAAVLPGDAMTHVGTVIGTPQYMSPEQARGEPVGPLSDIYNLGLILYAILAGRPAIPNDTLMGGDPVEKAKAAVIAPPRSLDPRVPRALEAICLKAMAAERDDRYGTARELAVDLRNWLADEPVSAWKEPWTSRLRRFLWHHQTPVASVVVAILALGFAASWYLIDAEIRAARQHAERVADARADVRSLALADVRAVPQIIDRLEPDLALVENELRQLARGAPRTGVGRRVDLKAALALLEIDRSAIGTLEGALVEERTDPAELRVVSQALRDHGYGQSLCDGLWKRVMEIPGELDPGRLRAAGALATFQPLDERWSSLGPRVASTLVRLAPKQIDEWAEVFELVESALAPSLRRVYGSDIRPERRAIAYTILFSFATRPANRSMAEDLVALVSSAEPAQISEIIQSIGESGRDRAAGRLELLLDRGGAPAGSVDRAAVAAALIAIGRPQSAWPLLAHSPDPGARTKLIHILHQVVPDPTPIMERSRRRVDSDVSVRRALVVALGTYPPARLLGGAASPFRDELLETYKRDPDPGLHSAIAWLLGRKLGFAETIKLIDQSISAGFEVPVRGWAINRERQTFVIIPGPLEFLMGSPVDESGRRSGGESPHRRRIGRSFAIATREVTRAEFERFIADRSVMPPALDPSAHDRLMPDPDCPMVGVDWYAATRYCNWLSQRDGIPPEEWCYPGDMAPGKSITLEPGFSSRTGYRLPTEAEWEFACRAGAITARPFGEGDTMLAEYAWFVENSGQRTHPVGSLEPNDLGLFDMLGNVIEWTQDELAPGGDYPAAAAGGVIEDSSRANPVSDRTDRIVRGGSFYHARPSLRSANRNGNSPAFRDKTVGFRVARTLTQGKKNAAGGH